jgi:hypothetical protein
MSKSIEKLIRFTLGILLLLVAINAFSASVGCSFNLLESQNPPLVSTAVWPAYRQASLLTNGKTVIKNGVEY